MRLRRRLAAPRLRPGPVHPPRAPGAAATATLAAAAAVAAAAAGAPDDARGGVAASAIAADIDGSGRAGCTARLDERR
jgi:hypothetical protein